MNKSIKPKASKNNKESQSIRREKNMKFLSEYLCIEYSVLYQPISIIFFLPGLEFHMGQICDRGFHLEGHRRKQKTSTRIGRKSSTYTVRLPEFDSQNPFLHNKNKIIKFNYGKLLFVELNTIVRFTLKLLSHQLFLKISFSFLFYVN